MNDITEIKDRPHNADKQVVIIVNGTEKTVSDKELSFSQIAKLAFEDPPTGDNLGLTITFSGGRGDKTEGILSDGESVNVKEGMVFDVIATDKS